MYEAELKADVTAISDLHARILATGGIPNGRVCFHDTYYDTPCGTLMGTERELRLRLCSGDRMYALLTYKGRPVDAQTRSKPECETQVSDPSSARDIICGMGYVPVCRLKKQCDMYEMRKDGHRLELVIVSVVGIPRIFLEIELPTAERCDVSESLACIKTVMQGLGIPEQCLTSEYYTDMIKKYNI